MSNSDQARMNIITQPGMEFAPTSRKWQGIPAIERAGNGRLWAAWYTGGEGEGPGNCVVLATSGDDGATWTDPVLAVAPPVADLRAYDPCLWIDPAGRLWLFWAQSTQWHDGRAGVWAIRAGDATGPRPAFGPMRRIANGVMMNKPTVAAGGDWLLPIAVWNKEPFVPELAAERFSSLFVSRDGGETFTRLGGADVPDRVFDEHMVVQRRDGSLWMLVRTSYGVGQSVSRDDGATWTPGERAAIPGPNSRFFIRCLRSGRLLLITHDLLPMKPVLRNRLTAYLSDDDGATWPAKMMLDERAGVSYPDAVEDEAGRILAIYDYNRGDCYALGKDREILLAAFTEGDILAGARVDPRCKLRQLVSKASG